ncbi:MAG: 5-formyltetrahydrofolate cyclo-ligase [Cyclobacteriaceae bacterium]|nr:5-formyltetrahydrofolate cyclo-ligase [Cyclobacteriaceae bacterium]
MKDKSSLRKEYLQKRKSITATERGRMSDKIAALFFKQFPARSFECIHIYLPIEKLAEVDTWPIIRECHSLQKRVLIPFYDAKNQDMLTAILRPGEELRSNAWGSLEPLNPGLEPAPRPEIVIAPLLSFDEKGFRVGYGKGYYDRFMVKLAAKPVMTGLSFFEPEQNITDVNEWDYPLDFCITPLNLYDFTIADT